MSPKHTIARVYVPLARSAREKGEHYADFKVGAIGYISGPSGETVIVEGANTKRAPDVPKDCAEMKIMRQVERSGLILDGLVIVGRPRKEDTTRTLHPCEACEAIMYAHLRAGTVVKRSTHITCVNPLDSSIEEFTLEEFLTARGRKLD